MVPGVSNDQMSIGRHSQALGTVERVAFRIDEREKTPLFVKHLNTRVAPIGDDDDVGLGVNGDACRSVELAIAFAARPEGEQESAAGGIKYFDAMIVIIRDQYLVGGGIDGNKLRRGELMLAGASLAESEGRGGG